MSMKNRKISFKLIFFILVMVISSSTIVFADSSTGLDLSQNKIISKKAETKV